MLQFFRFFRFFLLINTVWLGQSIKANHMDRLVAVNQSLNRQFISLRLGDRLLAASGREMAILKANWVPGDPQLHCRVTFDQGETITVSEQQVFLTVDQVFVNLKELYPGIMIDSKSGGSEVTKIDHCRVLNGALRLVLVPPLLLDLADRETTWVGRHIRFDWMKLLARSHPFMQVPAMDHTYFANGLVLGDDVLGKLMNL